MKDKDIIAEIIDELTNVAEMRLTFTTSTNGIQYGLTSKVIKLFHGLSKQIQDSDSKLSTIELNSFIKIVTQCVVDFHSEYKFKNFKENDIDITRDLKLQITAVTNGNIKKYTHYIPVSTLGMEKVNTVSFKFVKILSIENLIDSINITGRKCFNNYDCREYLKNKLEKKEIIIEAEEPCNWMLDLIYEAIKSSSSFIKVDINNYEKDLSFKLAKIVAKTTLDSISLLFNEDVFYQQVLLSEKNIPISIYQILESNHRLHLPGMSLTQRIPMITAKKAYSELNNEKNENFINSISNILYSLSNPEDDSYHPSLSSRWATALDWYAEGVREQNDAIAVAKIATALDVLSKGGKYKGILNMLKKIFKISEEVVIYTQIDKKITVKNFVKIIYDSSRSKVLHGTHHQRLESFETNRKMATKIVKIVLLKSMILLYDYKGRDFDEGFSKLIESFEDSKK